MSSYKALEIWTAQTLCNVGILLSFLSLILHIGRPYFERILGRFTLRVAADLWWLVYVMLRDGSLLISFLFGFLHLNLDLMADIKIGLPFVPFGTVLLAAALLTKLLRNTEDINKSFRISTYFLMGGALMNMLGYVLVMEAPGSEYPAAQTMFWQTMRSWRSNLNPWLSTVTFYITIVLLFAIVIFGAVKVLKIYRKIEDKEEVKA